MNAVTFNVRPHRTSVTTSTLQLLTVVSFLALMNNTGSYRVLPVLTVNELDFSSERKLILRL